MSKPDMLDSVVVVSGGLDSVTLLHYLVKSEGRSPAVVTFAYGQKHDQEIDYARQQVALLDVRPHLVLDLAPMAPLFTSSALTSAAIDVPTMADVEGDPQPVTYVPNRNMIFLALAAAYAESNNAGEVFYGAQRHDRYGYWDTTPQFLEKLNSVFALNRPQAISIKAPFVNDSKADVLRRGLTLGVDYSLTWSCYEGQEVACGRCPTCVERLEAFAEIGTADPLPYAG